MRLNRTWSVLAVACLLPLAGLSACGSSTTNAARTGVGSVVTSPTVGVSGTSLHCEKPPAPATSTPHLKLPSEKTAAGKTFTAVLQTTCGNITFELYGAKAPQTVASFLQLAKHYWDNSPCHRLTTQGIYVLQCGDPTGTGTGSPGYGFGVENAPSDGDYPAGTVAMARGESPDTNGGQFFVVYKDTTLPVSTGGYSIFGKVIRGMDVVNAVAKAGTNSSTGDGAPTQPISILKVTVMEKKSAA